MSLTSGQSVSWADIQNLYTAMNTERTRFSMSTVTVPSNPGLTVTENVTALNDLVNAMSSNSFLTNVAVTGVVAPNRGVLLSATPYTRISSTIEAIRGVCIHCSFGDDGFGFDGFTQVQAFGFDSGCKGFTHAANFTFAYR